MNIMTKKYFLSLLLLLIFSKSIAIEISCDSNYVTSSNTLRAISLFSARSIAASQADELAPDVETRKNKVVTQTWKLNSSREEGKHLYVACGYQDGSEIAKQIPNSVDICTFTFSNKPKLSPTDVKPSFTCFTK